MIPSNFVIKSKMNGLVMDIKGGKVAQDNYIQMYKQHGRPNQCWVMDEANHALRCLANQAFVLDVGAGGGLVIHKFVQASSTQKWKVQGDQLVNIGTGKVADISGQNRAQGAKVITYTRTGGANQKWKFETPAGVPVQFAAETAPKSVQPAAPPAAAKAAPAAAAAPAKPKQQTAPAAAPPKAKVQPAKPEQPKVVHIHHHHPPPPEGAVASPVVSPSGYCPPQPSPVVSPNSKTSFGLHRNLAALDLQKQSSTISGRNFIIRSKLNGLVLDVLGSAQPGARIITARETLRSSKQLWYMDPVSNTIRNKADDKLVIDIGTGGRLMLNTFVPGLPNQQWIISGDSLRCLGNDQVADIEACNNSPGASIITYIHNGQINQQWLIEYKAREYFQIVSRLNNKVLDIGGHNKHSPGSPVYMYRPTGADSQLWYEDQQGNIFSKLCGLTLKATPQGLVTAPLNMANPGASWMKIGEQIVNRSNHRQCLDIANSSSMDNATVVARNKNGGRNQAWYYQWM